MFKLLPLFLILSLFFITCSNNSNQVTSNDRIQDNISDNESIVDNDTDTDTDSDDSNDNSSDNGTDTPDEEENQIIGGAVSDNDTYTFIPPVDCSYHTSRKPITSIIAGTNRGIFYSTDNGVTWSKSTLPVGLDSSWSALVDIGNNTVLAGSGGDRDDLSELGIIKSTDGGATWQRTGMKHGKWNDILFFNDNIILASSNTTAIGGVWRSTDNGSSWIKNKRVSTVDPIDADSVELADGISSGIVTALGKIDNCTIIVGKDYQTNMWNYNPLHISKDGGKKWFRVTNPPYAKSVSQFLLHSSGNMFATLDNNLGIIKSDYSPEYDWKFVIDSRSFGPIIELRNGVVVTGVKSIIQSSPDISSLVHGGIWLSNDSGENYYISSMNKYFWLSLLELDDNAIIGGCTDVDKRSAEHQCSGLYKSVDSGNSWNKVNNTLSNLIIYKLIAVRR